MRQTLKVNSGGSRVVQPEKPKAEKKAAKQTEKEVKKDAD